MKTLLLVLTSSFSVVGILVCFLFTLVGIPRNVATVVSLFGKKKKKSFSDKTNSYAIVICARNEERVLGRLLDSIHKQKYPAEALKVFVVADNCTDATARVAKEAGAVVFERNDTSRIGKAYALELAFSKVREDPFVKSCAGFLLFDADNILDEEFVLQMNRTVNGGAHLAKGFRNTSNFGAGLLPASHGMYFLSENALLDLGRSRMGQTCFLTGTGIFMERALIEKENGWQWFLLSEDTEATVDVFLKYGYYVEYCADAVFYDEQPVSWKASFRQRTRWLFGTAQVFRRYGTKTAKRWFTGDGWSAFDLFCQLSMSGYVTGTAFIMNVLSIFTTLLFQGWQPALLSLGIYLGTLYGVFWSMGALTMAVCGGKIALSWKEKMKTLFYFPVFMVTFLPIAVVAVAKKRVEWQPISHGESEIDFVA